MQREGNEEQRGERVEEVQTSRIAIKLDLFLSGLITKFDVTTDKSR